MSTPICIVDCETTSLGPDRRAWEVATIRFEPGSARITTVWHVADIDMSNADPKSLEIGGFYERHTREDAPVRSVLEFRAAKEIELETRHAVLIGINPAFDAEVLAAMLRRHKLVPAWHYSVVDLKAMAAGWLWRNGDKPVRTDAPGRVLDLPWSTEALARHCNVELPSDADRHTALGDVLFAERWFERLTGGAS